MTKGLGNRFRIAAGLLLCAAIALGASSLTLLHAWRGFLPIAFGVLLVLLAWRYGVPVAVIGAPLTAFIFAYFIFPPTHSFRVENEAARASLGWMVLGSIVISYLLVHPPRNPKEK